MIQKIEKEHDERILCTVGGLFSVTDEKSRHDVKVQEEAVYSVLFLGAFEKLRQATGTFVVTLRLHVASRLLLDGW